jgi:putative Mg2+ transporter-C (MgtC) family protein
MPWFLEAAAAEATLLPRILLAGALSAAIGWEREARGRPAGLRTHIIMGLSAALLVSLGDVLVGRYSGVAGTQIDPLRIMEAIVAGVSFIGAGTIFVSGKNDVRGLTTAASLLATTIVALATGLGLYVLAVVTTLVLLLVLRLLPHVEPSKAAEEEARK